MFVYVQLRRSCLPARVCSALFSTELSPRGSYSVICLGVIHSVWNSSMPSTNSWSLSVTFGNGEPSFWEIFSCRCTCLSCALLDPPSPVISCASLVPTLLTECSWGNRVSQPSQKLFVLLEIHSCLLHSHWDPVLIPSSTVLFIFLQVALATLVHQPRRGKLFQ